MDTVICILYTIDRSSNMNHAMCLVMVLAMVLHRSVVIYE